jgi:hypothetical protein
MGARAMPACSPVASMLTDPAAADWRPLERFLACVRASGVWASAAEFRWVACSELVDGLLAHCYRHVAADRNLHVDVDGNARRTRRRAGQLMLQADRRRPVTVYDALVEMVGLDVPHSIVAGWSRRRRRGSGAA